MTRAREPVSNRQILMLRSEAFDAGDMQQVALCEIAIYGEPIDGLNAATIYLLGMTREAARAECERVIQDRRELAEDSDA